MTVEAVDTATGEVIETISETEARRLTTEAKNEFKSASDHFGKAWALVEEAVKGGGHLALGYRSPGDYLHAEFDGVLSGLDVAQRRVAVRSMSSWGLSSRAIAPSVGVSDRQVRNDLQVGSHFPPDPEPSPAPGWRSATEALGDLTDNADPAHDEPAPWTPPEAPKVTGIDGKQYSRPEPTPRRRPLGDGFRDASLDLGKVITRIENLVSDDRFSRNKNEVARYANDLIRARDALQRVIDQMS